MTSLRLSTRSTITPAKSANSVNGPNRATESSPSASGECVRLRTSQYIAMFCIHVPLTDTTWPPKNSR